jgi:hypothetical protein
VKDESTRRGQMALINSMESVHEILSKYEDNNCVSIIVIKGKVGMGACMNTLYAIELIPLSKLGVSIIYSVDDEGVLSKSQQSAIVLDYIYLNSQQSNNKLQKDKQIDFCFSAPRSQKKLKYIKR